MLDKKEKDKDDIGFKMKRNIAEFIYHTASDFGVNLVVGGRDSSFETWKQKRDAAKAKASSEKEKNSRKNDEL